jgi:CDP-diacylglycerol--serine O-phosphatidyltransferase
MSKDNSLQTKTKQPTILFYVKDFPNILSLSGLAATLLAIYLALQVFTQRL